MGGTGIGSGRANGRRAVFLDRDGVLNRMWGDGDARRPPRELAELRLMPGAAQACERLRQLGYLLVIITNQPDVARGTLPLNAANVLNREIASVLKVDDVRVCFHDDADNCECRKPRPGMIFSACDALGIDPTRSFVIGDRWRDVLAGQAAGCNTVLLDGSESERLSCAPSHHAFSLEDAVRYIEAHDVSRDVVPLSGLRVKIFADGADEPTIRALSADPLVKGFTTNPTLMRHAGVDDYEGFARMAITVAAGRPLSLEVFADDFDEMEAQALTIASWGQNVFVKIPVTDTRGNPSYDLIRRLAHAGVQLNVTAVFTLEQVRAAADALAEAPRAFVSLFAGRIADTGRDPVPHVENAVRALEGHGRVELIWASPREVLNLIQADAAGCHVITMTRDLIAKTRLIGKDLSEYSLDTVRMFFEDAQRAGYHIRSPLDSAPV